MSSKNVLPSSAASELENSLKTTISDWLQNIRLSQCRYIASNLEAYGVCFVEDFECLKKEEFVSALSNSDSSMRVIEVRRATAEFAKVHNHFEQKHSPPAERVSSSASNFNISHITNPMSIRKFAQKQQTVPSNEQESPLSSTLNQKLFSNSEKMKESKKMLEKVLNNSCVNLSSSDSQNSSSDSSNEKELSTRKLSCSPNRN